MPDVRQFTSETERSVVPPAFDSIVARRRERTRNRLIIAAAACLAVIVAVLGVMSSGWQNRAARIPATTPGVSPTTTWLSFSSGFGIEVMHPDGTDRHVLLDKLDKDPYDLSWGPGGSQVAWVTIEADNSRDVWAADVVDGSISGPRRIFDCSGPCTSTRTPSFSPDGRNVVFGLDRSNGSELRIVDARTGAVRRSIPVPPDYSGAAWSPDGRYLALTVGSTTAGGVNVANIGIVDLTASSPAIRRLDTGGDNGHDPAWSPDGSRLVYVDARGGNYDAGGDLVTVRPDGSDRRKITHQAAGSGFFTPTWSRDGRSIYSTLSSHPGDGTIEKVDVSTGKVTEVRDRLGNTLLANYPRLG